MPALRFVLSMALGIIPFGAASADDKAPTNKEKIVGTWEMPKTDKKGESTRLRFTKDGKISIIMLREDEGPGRLDGNYTLDGDTIKVGLMGTEKWKIKSVNDKELVFTNESNGQTTTCKKIDADPKAAKNQEMLIGKWEVVKWPEGNVGVIVEFTKDGKMKWKDAKDPQTGNLAGTYEVDGDSVISFDLGVALQWKFKSLTDKEMTVDWKKINEKKMTLELKKK